MIWWQNQQEISLINLSKTKRNEWDESQFFPKELFKKAGEFGFMGILVPERLGGSEARLPRICYNN